MKITRRKLRKLIVESMMDDLDGGFTAQDIRRVLNLYGVDSALTWHGTDASGDLGTMIMSANRNKTRVLRALQDELGINSRDIKTLSLADRAGIRVSRGHHVKNLDGYADPELQGGGLESQSALPPSEDIVPTPGSMLTRADDFIILIKSK